MFPCSKVILFNWNNYYEYTHMLKTYGNNSKKIKAHKRLNKFLFQTLQAFMQT